MGNIKKIFRKIIKLLEKDKLWLLIILTIIVVFLKINRLEISFGIVLDFSTIALMLILLIFGIEKALIITTISTVGYIIFFKGEYLEFINILNIATLGMLCKKKWKLNIIISEFIFWIIATIPVIYSIFLLSGVNELKNYHYFPLLFLIINGIFSAFLAEIINVYLIKGRSYKENLLIPYKEIILHIVTLAILIPFLINIFTNLDNSYDEICSNTESSSEEIYYYLLEELEGWNEKSITNFKLSGVIETALIKDLINKTARYKPYNIHITNSSNKIILDIKNYNKEITRYKEYKFDLVRDNLYKVLPINKDNKYFNSSWADGYFLYVDELGDLGLTLMVEVPIDIYSHRIISEYLRQFKFLLFFTLFIAIVTTILNRIIFNNLYKLSTETKNLPEKLKRNISIIWPKSNITEINTLTNNIENMSFKLRENFVKLNKTQEKLYELAYYDTLTKLPNRVFFKKYFEELIYLNGTNKKITIIFVDLNRFKIINDTWGHHIGDMLLIEVAKRFKTIKSDNCNVFRLGGDEFVFVANVKENYEIDEIGKKIISTFKDNFKINDLIINTKCSLGASIYPDDGEDIDTIIKFADIAMYNSKENGGNYLQFFNEKIREVVIEKIAIEEGINKALKKNQFILYYQPKFSGRDEEITSLEALIRWENSSLGIVPPNKFIPIAEESDLIMEIDKWVLLNACRENKALQEQGYKKIPVSVNISAKHFAHRELLEVVKNALNKSNLEAKYLKIEITESVLIKNLAMVSEIIMELKKIGIQVSIDDFGKGYSSINQLMSLPINEVKIDRDFIKNINKDIKKKNVVKLIIELAHSLNLNVVAEGIEVLDEKEYLKKINCDELQGYLFSRPIKVKELKELLKGEKIEYEA